MQLKTETKTPATDSPNTALKHEYSAPCTTLQSVVASNTKRTLPGSSISSDSESVDEHVHVRVFCVYWHSLRACNRLICITVVVTVTKAQVSADAKLQAPDNFICNGMQLIVLYELFICYLA
jgi:hypothetical protein